MEKVLAYIDESGDPRFNEGASSHLEYSAILIEEDQEADILKQLSNIKQDLKLTQFKSSSIRTEKRRVEILKALKEVRFKYINLFIDKSKVIGEWKNYPQVFYKYTQQILHGELYKLFPNRSITIDKFGTEEYQKSLKEYLEKHQQLELFDAVVNIGSAKESDIIQLADLYAGTHRIQMQKGFERYDVIEELLKLKELFVIRWPEDFQRFIIHKIANEDDRKIADIAISFAERYISQQKQNIRDEASVLVLEYLLFKVKFVSYSSFVYTVELIEWLRQMGMKYSEEEFRKEVLGKLRDDGVVIAGSRKGLKIPTSTAELIDYINYTSNKYLTMARRLRETYNTLNGSALGEMDLFNSSEFEVHKEIFKVIDRH